MATTPTDFKHLATAAPLRAFQAYVAESAVGSRYDIEPRDVQVQEVGHQYRVDVAGFRGYVDNLNVPQEDFLAALAANY
jgi:hypothetical protein